MALCKHGKQRSVFVHKLVALAFWGEHKGQEVNHINADKSDNRLCNLEIVTHRDNMKHAGAYGLMKRDTERNACGRYTRRALKELNQ